jgi:hypothetical protein
MDHDYFGKIEKGWTGFCSEHKIKLPYFNKEVELFLGSEYDDDFNEKETPPSENELKEYENTIQKFIEVIDGIIKLIKEDAFEYYKKYYAKYYENEFIIDGFFETDEPEGKVHEPLNINNSETHFEYMKNIDYIRIFKDNRILLPILYKLDTEHGIEILLKNNEIETICGLGETESRIV